jgi:predicted nucleic acid-binding protein
VILVDSSVWIDHFRRASAELAALLASRVVMVHPFIVGELACGHLPRREAVFTALGSLPTAPVVPHDEVLAFVERHRLMARGIGWVDMHLLASATVAGRVSLWSRDKRLMTVAAERGVVYARATD